MYCFCCLAFVPQRSGLCMAAKRAAAGSRLQIYGFCASCRSKWLKICCVRGCVRVRGGWRLFLLAQFGEHLVADVDGGRGEDDAGGFGGAVEDELVAALLGNALDGVVHLVLDGLDEGDALLVEFALWAEVLLAQFAGFLLLIYDGLLALLLLGFAEEDALVLVVLVEGGGFVADGLYFVLPGS